MKKKDQSEPENKRRRKSARTESHDRDKEPNVSPAKTTRAEEQGNPHSTAKKSPKSSVATKTDVSKKIDFSEVSVMQIEEDEAEQRSSKDDVDLYKKTCEEIQRLVSEINSLKAKGMKHSDTEIVEKRVQASLLTTSLRKLNRLSLIRSKKAKEKTQELKQKVDVLHLDLQNLLYEVMHMKKEIHKCTEFTSKDEDIELVAIEEFYSEAPEVVSRPSVTKGDSHQQMLARLEWELEQRKKLASMKDQLVMEKKDMEKDITDKRETLNSLKPSLQGILKSTLPVQEKMGLDIDARKAQYEIATYLPSPLYVLYVQAIAYRDASDRYLIITIEGDVQAAKALFERDNQDIGEYEESDNDETNDAGDKEDNKRRKHKKDKEMARLEEQRKTVLRKHPLTVTLKINCKASVAINVQFSYLSTLHIVTTSTSLGFPKDNSFPVLTTSSLLSPGSVLKNLFPDDDGNTTPNPSNQYQLKDLGLEDFTTYIPQIGKPYDWAQRVCGLLYLKNSPGQTKVPDAVLSSQNIEVVTKKIKARISSRLSLQKQLSSLETLVVPTSKNQMTLFPTNILSRLVNWKCITYSDLKVLDFAREKMNADLMDENDTFYLVTLKRDQEIMQAVISIGVDYPNQPPLFALTIKSTKNYVSSKDDREIECELNTNFEELMEHEPDMLLTNALKRLLVCFDVYCETGETGLKQERLFIKSRRGRDRIRPYKYHSDRGFFIHR